MGIATIIERVSNPPLSQNTDHGNRIMTAIRYELDENNIAILTMDAPDQSANTMNADFRKALGEVITRLDSDRPRIKGTIMASAKTFSLEDLRELVQVTPAQAKDFQTMLTTQITGPLRKLETFGFPVVAAINGTALGGGWRYVWHATTALW